MSRVSSGVTGNNASSISKFINHITIRNRYPNQYFQLNRLNFVEAPSCMYIHIYTDSSECLYEHITTWSIYNCKTTVGYFSLRGSTVELFNILPATSIRKPLINGFGCTPLVRGCICIVLYQ